MIRVLVVGAVLCAACKNDGASTDETLATPSPNPKKGSAGGFAATLSADLAEPGPGSGRTAGTATGEASGSATASGSAAPIPPPGPASGSGSAMAGSGSAPAATPPPTQGSGSAKPAATPPATTPAAGSGSAKPAATPPTTTPAAGSGSAKPTTTPAAAGSASAPVARPAVVMTPELKAIQLSLLPNWKRDDGEAATISLFVDVQSRGETAVFKFHYGYDDPRAPADRDAYKKFLGETKILAVTADRQRGAAWYLEGTDASGHLAFRIVVTYGGKRLVCYGSLYKDSPFGDIRDEVVIQAKKICETIQL